MRQATRIFSTDTYGSQQDRGSCGCTRSSQPGRHIWRHRPHNDVYIRRRCGALQ